MQNCGGHKISRNYVKVFSSTSDPRKRRKRPDPFSFLRSILIYVLNETEFKALGLFMSLSSDHIEFICSHTPNLQLSHCIGPVFHDFVVGVRALALTPERERRREKKPTTFLHSAAPRLRGTRSNYRLYILPFFSACFPPSPVLQSLREGRRGGLFFCTIHESRRGW